MPQTSPVRVRVALTGTVVGAVLVALGVIAPAVEAAPPSSYGVSGVDTSHYNHETTGSRRETVIDWNRVAVSNSFAFLKATQGVSSKDDYFARDYAAAARTSLLRAPYHFFHARTTADGAGQARHFVATARAAGYRGTGERWTGSTAPGPSRTSWSFRRRPGSAPTASSAHRPGRHCSPADEARTARTARTAHEAHEVDVAHEAHV
ncbi:GH25 family lysozyme [Streptomyces sp. BE133]|nr:GH25 family lysozyme [Streptomyces sp. BE133]MEE1807386.1 GH25 family lysozyme [Streptomyces sp. BE133]